MGLLKNGFLVAAVSAALVNIPKLFMRRPPTYLGDGYAAPGWERVIHVFRDNVQKGLERGSAFAVYHKGKLVVNYAGGYADVEAEWKWDVNTLCQIFSSTKGVMATLMAMLVDRGLMKYDEPIATYWPEFAQNGKDRITVEQLLSHQAGLAAIDEKMSGLGDPDERASILAKQKPNWTPGEQHGYHALSLGLYADEILRRVDPEHRDVRQFFQEEVANKYGVDLQMGLGDPDVYRTARMYTVSPSLFELPVKLMECRSMWYLIYVVLMDQNSLAYRATTNPIEYHTTNPNYPNNPGYRRMTNPSAMGYATAEGLAKFWNIVASGGKLDGKRLISEDVLRKMSEVLVTGYDQVLLFNTSYSRGVIPQNAPDQYDGINIGAPGVGGQMGYADPKRHLSWGYITNHHMMAMAGEDPRYKALISATYQVVDELQQIRRVKDVVND